MIRYVTFFLSIFILSNSYCQSWISSNGFWDKQLSTSSTSKQWGAAYDIATALQSTIGTGTTINAVTADTSLFSWSAKTSEYSYLTDTANELSWLSHDSIDNAFAHSTTISNQTSRSLFIQSTTYTAQTVYNVFSNSTLYSANTAYQVYINSSTFAKLYADIIYGNATSYSANTVYTVYVNSTAYSATSIYNSFVNSTTYAYQTSLKFFNTSTSLSAFYTDQVTEYYYGLSTSYAHTFASNTAFGVFSSITGSNLSYYGSNTYKGNQYYNTALWSGYGQYTSSVFKFGNYGISNGHGYIYWNNAPFIKFLFASTATENTSSDNLLTVYGNFKGTFTGSIDTSSIALYANIAGQSTTALSSDSSGISGYAYFAGSSDFAGISGRSYNSNTSDNLSWLSKDSISNTYSNATLLSTNQYNANSTYTYSKYTSALSESSTKTVDLINYVRFPTWTAISSANLDGYLASPFVDGSTLFVVSGSTNATTMIHWSSDLVTWSKRTMSIISNDYADKSLALGGYHFVIGTDGLYRSSDLRTSDGTKILSMPLSSMFVDGGSLWVLSNMSAYKSIDYGNSFSPQFSIVPSYSYGIYPTVAKTADGFILGRGSYTYYQYSGQGYSLKSIDNAGVLGTRYGIIAWSIYTGSNFKDNPGFIYRLSGDSFYIIASTDRSLTCGYDDGIGKVWFGWDEGLTTSNQGFIYSYDGNRVNLEARGSNFPQWQTNGRVRSIIRKDNEIVALAGGAFGNGVIYVRSLTKDEYRNDNKSYGLFNKYVHGTTYRYSSLTVDRLVVNEGIKYTSSAYTTIVNGTLSAASASSVLLDGAGNATYQTGSVDGITVSSDIDGGIMIGSDYPFESVWMYLTSADSSGSWSGPMSNWTYWDGSIWKNITLSYDSSNGFHGTNYTAKFGLPSSILSDWAKSNQGYGSKYYIMSNWGYVSATIDAVSTVNILSAITTVNYSQSTIDRLHTNTLSATTADIDVLSADKLTMSNASSIMLNLYASPSPSGTAGTDNSFANYAYGTVYRWFDINMTRFGGSSLSITSAVIHLKHQNASASTTIFYIIKSSPVSNNWTYESCFRWNAAFDTASTISQYTVAFGAEAYEKQVVINKTIKLDPESIYKIVAKTLHPLANYTSFNNCNIWMKLED